MAMLFVSEFRRVVERANLAPSVHNTQPTRWRLDADGAVLLFIDGARQLAVADPEGRDARLSCGAAMEGTRLALSEMGLGTSSCEVLPQGADHHSPVARIEIAERGAADPLAGAVLGRFTWRGGFVEARVEQRTAIAGIAAGRDDAALVSDAEDIARLAEMNDRASLSFFRRRPYRDELLSWMRLSRSHPNWSLDGLNAQSLAMTGLEATAARIVLRSPMFDAIDALGLSSALVSEEAKTKSAAAIILFHRPVGEDPIDSGVAFYRLLLVFAAIGLSVWPMSVLADDPDFRAEISHRHGISPDRRLLNVLRVGAIPSGAAASRARLRADSLIV